VALSSVFDGRDADDLCLVPQGFYDSGRSEVLLAEAAAHIDRQRRVVTTSTGRQVGYDALVLATGSYAFVPQVPGHDLPGCFVYRTLDDLDAIRAHCAGARRGVVVGGGLLGLEAANALRSLGLQTSVVEFAPRLMPAQVDTWAVRCCAGTSNRSASPCTWPPPPPRSCPAGTARWRP
jgi:nitrite reductase (NADH) large subunit